MYIMHVYYKSSDPDTFPSACTKINNYSQAGYLFITFQLDIIVKNFFIDGKIKVISRYTMYTQVQVITTLEYYYFFFCCI